MSDFFNHITQKNPEELRLCLPVRNAYGEVVDTLCTGLHEFPCYLLKNGIDDFFKATIIKDIIAPLDWQFVEDFAWQERNADASLTDDERDIVLKRFVMSLKGSETRLFL